MTYEQSLFTALRSLVSDRVHPLNFPQETLPLWPKIRYTFIDIVPLQDICGDGDDATSEVRVQLDVVAATAPQMRSLRLSVMAAMRTFIPPARLEIASEDFDDVTKTYRAVLDYSLHGSSP